MSPSSVWTAIDLALARSSTAIASDFSPALRRSRAYLSAAFGSARSASCAFLASSTASLLAFDLGLTAGSGCELKGLMDASGANGLPQPETRTPPTTTTTDDSTRDITRTDNIEFIPTLR